MKGIIKSACNKHFAVAAENRDDYLIRRRDVIGCEQQNIAVGALVDFSIKRGRVKNVIINPIRKSDDIPDSLVGQYYGIAEKHLDDSAFAWVFR